MNIKELNKNEITITFYYDSDTIKRINKINGRRLESKRRYWIIPNNAKSKSKLIKVLIDYDMDWSNIFKFTIINFNDLYNFNREKSMSEMNKQLTLKGLTKCTI